MNTTARLTIPMEDSLRTQLHQRAVDLGFDSSQALLRYVSKAIVDGRAISFGRQLDGWDSPPAHVVARWEKDLRELESDRKAGKVKDYTNVDRLLNDLLADEAN